MPAYTHTHTHHTHNVMGVAEWVAEQSTEMGGKFIGKKYIFPAPTKCFVPSNTIIDAKKEPK